MAISTLIKNYMNVGLARYNLEITTKTAERKEARRLAALVDQGHFDNPVFPLLPQFAKCQPDTIINAIRTYRNDTKRIH